mgnify:CR=1 FL=1
MAPISSYYGGHGSEVMRKMKKKHGSKKGESAFYATAKKRSAHGSSQFTANDIARGYAVCYDSTELAKMEEGEHLAAMNRGRRASHASMLKGEEY